MIFNIVLKVTLNIMFKNRAIVQKGYRLFLTICIKTEQIYNILYPQRTKYHIFTIGTVVAIT
jgi:hypothetical protein